MEGLFSHKLPKLYVTQSGSIHDFLVFSSLAETRMKGQIERAETREFWLRKVCVSNDGHAVHKYNPHQLRAIVDPTCVWLCLFIDCPFGWPDFRQQSMDDTN